MRALVAVGAGLLFMSSAGVRMNAQVQYATGQNVAPTFEGWEHNPDGTFSLVFGYLNRNYEEELDIPIGTANSISMGPETYGDRGQPTHFYPRRQRFLFRVVVPADWDKKAKVTWTLTSHGKTDQAKGWLQPEWELSEGVIVENMGGGVPDPDNKPPSVTISAAQTVTLPLNKATLTASAKQTTGFPKPYRKTPSNSRPRLSASPSARCVQIKWILYRGPGSVTFRPRDERSGLRSAVEPDVENDFRRTGHLRAAGDRR